MSIENRFSHRKRAQSFVLTQYYCRSRETELNSEKLGSGAAILEEIELREVFLKGSKVVISQVIVGSKVVIIIIMQVVFACRFCVFIDNPKLQEVEYLWSKLPGLFLTSPIWMSQNKAI